MKKMILLLSLITIASAWSSESYFNFPTVKAEFKNLETCTTWVQGVEAKYGSEKIIKAASGCIVTPSSYHPKKGFTAASVEGKVVLDIVL